MIQPQLKEILDDPQNAKWIAWLPHGRAFVIYHKREFATDVLSKYCMRTAKYSSFSRKLNRWGFVRVPRGPEIGAYYHPLFRQSEGQLVQQMTCLPSTPRSRNNAASSAMRANGESARGAAIAVVNDPPPPSILLDPYHGNSSYCYASYNYQHPNAFAPMDYPLQQSCGPYGYDPAGEMPPLNAHGPYGPYQHCSFSTMYPPPYHPHCGMVSSASYSMFDPSHVMEGYGSYDMQYNNHMVMSHRGVDPQQPCHALSSYYGDGIHAVTASMNKLRNIYVSDKMKELPSSFHLTRKDRPYSPFCPPFTARKTDGPHHHPEKEEEARGDGGLGSSSFSVDHSEAPRKYCELGYEETSYSSALVWRPLPAYDGPHEERGSNY
jgi:HSF-type DNA-binding